MMKEIKEEMAETTKCINVIYVNLPELIAVQPHNIHMRSPPIAMFHTPEGQ